MDIGRRKEEKEKQAGATADEGMDPITTQEWAWMHSASSVAKGSIRVRTTPGQNGHTINDQITSTHESAAQSDQNREDKQGYGPRCPRLLSSFPLLRSTGNARVAILAHRQATRQGKPRANHATSRAYLDRKDATVCARARTRNNDSSRYV